jgi:hypothetical protein
LKGANRRCQNLTRLTVTDNDQCTGLRPTRVASSYSGTIFRLRKCGYREGNDPSWRKIHCPNRANPLCYALIGRGRDEQTTVD